MEIYAPLTLHPQPTADAFQVQNSSGAALGGFKAGGLPYGPAFILNGVKITCDTYANRPANPITNDIHIATDRSSIYRWSGSGSAWLSLYVGCLAMPIYPGRFTSPGLPFTSTTDNVYIQAYPDRAYDIYVTTVEFSIAIDSTNNSTNYWSAQLTDHNGTSIGTAKDTQLLTGGGIPQPLTLTVNTSISRNSVYDLRVRWVKTGSPGGLWPGSSASLNYRLVGG